VRRCRRPPRGLEETITPVESRNVTRLWAALDARDLLLARFPALEGVADLAGLSARHAARVMEEVFSAFKLEWSGWRDVMVDMRLRWAYEELSIRLAERPEERAELRRRLDEKRATQPLFDA
jgi:hypothetical protein